MKKDLRIATVATDLISFLEETIQRSNFSLQKINFSEQNQWSINAGALSHISNGFFHVSGLVSNLTKEEHLVLFQPQSALTGLILFKDDKEVYLLLQARVEPGNTNIGQYGPTIQSTPANYLQKHGGKKTSYVDFFTTINPKVNPLGINMQFDLGKRYYHKSKSHHYIEVDTLIETEENMIWAPLKVIVETLYIDNFLNADLRSLLSVFDWDLYTKSHFYNEGQKDFLQHNLDYCYKNYLGKSEWKLKPLEQLKKWNIENNGIMDVSNTGIWIDMYKFSSVNREVCEWSQPLLSCKNRGKIILYIRKINNNYEFLVSIQSEFGISGQVVVLPSYVIYPGENDENENEQHPPDSLITEIIQCDEGGRFYQNENIYQVVLIKSDINIKPYQKWINVHTLKGILTSSDQAGIQ